MLKKFFGLLALVVLMNFSVVDAAQVPSVTDNAKILDAQEIDALNKKIRTVEQAHKIKIGVAFVKSTGGKDIVAASNELLEKNFRGGQNGSIVLLVVMKQRKYEIDTDPTMRKIISDDAGISFLKEHFQPAMTSGDYSGAANNFVDGVDNLLTYYETNGVPYGTRTGFDPMAATMAVVIALFCGVVIRSWLIGSMSNIRHAAQATDYLKRETVQFSEKRDTFLFMNVKRRPKGGSNRGGGGGGSHGGGGHGGGGGSF